MLQKFLKIRKRAIVYFGKHVEYNALVHVIGGIGLGILIAGPIAFPHPIRWALVLLAISLLGHIYVIFTKSPKK